MASIDLPPHVYHRLRRLQAEAERDAARAEAVALRAAAEAQHTQQLFLLALARAGYAHDFDPTETYRWDDHHTALVMDDAPTTEDTRRD